MTDERRYSRQRQPQAPRSDTHSSYEEAIRRSNERLGRPQRSGARGPVDAQPVQRPANSDAYAAQRARQQRPQQAQRPRRTVVIDNREDYEAQPARGMQQGPYAQQPARQAPHTQQQPKRGIQLPNPFSRGQQTPGGYRDQQLQSHSRASGNYQARPGAFPMAAAPRAVSSNGFFIRVAICVVLLLVVIFSATRIGPAATALSEAQANVQTQQEELDALNTSNTDLQAQLDQMQETIDKYNELAKSS